MPSTVTIIGATGMLGRPVARVLAADSRFRVRAIVRDLDRARRCLPSTIECVCGDLRDPEGLPRLLEGTDALHLNLNTPFSERSSFDPDRDGTAAAIDAAKQAGVDRVTRISALEVSGDDDSWWVVRRKRETDDRLLGSALRATVFRPSWFMETLATLVYKPLMLSIPSPRAPFRWIAGADFGRNVAESLLEEAPSSSIIEIGGPEALTLEEATRRFAAAFDRVRAVVPVPRAALRVGSFIRPEARYLLDLLRVAGETDHAGTGMGAIASTTTIERYAASIVATGDMPRK